MLKTINVGNLIQEQPNIQEIVKNLAPDLNNLVVKKQDWKSGKLLFSSIKIDNISKLPLLNARDLWPAQYNSNYDKINLPYHPLAYLKEDYQDILANNNPGQPLIISVYKVVKDFKTRIIDDKVINELFSDNMTHNEYINSLSTAIVNQYYPLDNLLKGWSYPVDMNSKESHYTAAIYSDTVKENLDFMGAIVISKSNQAGLKRIEYCFDNEYRLDYVKNNNELKRIFNIK